MILILVIVVLVVILGVIGGLVGRFGFGCSWVGVLVIRGSGLVVIRVSRVLVLRCSLTFRSLLLFELWFVS